MASQSTPLRVGVIGLGWFGEVHCDAIIGIPELTLSALSTRNAERLKDLATKYKVAKAKTDFMDVINDPDIDVIVVTTAWDKHKDATIAALKAGKHVLCEKPFAMNVAEIELMVEAARKNDRLLVEAVWSRWHPRMIRMVEYVKAGNIGEIVSIDSSFTFPGSIDGNYRAVPAMGGGALFDVGVYPLHAIAALVGDDARVEIEKCDVSVGPTGVDLTTKWQMRINGSITANGLASFEMPENQSLIVRGERGSVELVGTQAFTSWHEASTLRLGEHTEDFDAVDPYRLMIENFGKRIQGQDSWVLPLETSLSVAKVLEQIQSSN